MTTERVDSEIEEPEGIGPDEDSSWGGLSARYSTHQE